MQISNNAGHCAPNPCVVRESTVILFPPPPIMLCVLSLYILFLYMLQTLQHAIITFYLRCHQSFKKGGVCIVLNVVSLVAVPSAYSTPFSISCSVILLGGKKCLCLYLL